MKTKIQPIIWQGRSFQRKELIAFLLKQKQQEIEKWEQDIIEFTLDWLNDEITSFEVFTSGSTGLPKSISINREQMQASARATAKALDLKEGNSALLVLPANFIAGKMMIVRAIELGMDLYYLPPQINVLAHINRHFDFTALIPLQVQFALENSLEKELYSFKKIIIGGASLHDKFRKQLSFKKTQFLATYGMTETITHVALKNLGKDEDLFQALPGISFQVDEQNCLKILSERLPLKVIQTNDVVELKSNKSFKLIGRADFIINTGGIKILPEIWEAQAMKVVNIPCALTFIDDEKLGQKLILLIESKEELKSEELIFKKLSSIFPSNQLPKSILFVDQLERTANNKLNRENNRKMACKMINKGL